MKKSRLKITTLTAALLILWGSSAWATLAQFDFGDAPESYTTLLGDDGARHMIFGISNLLLGSAIDAEED